MAQKAKYVLSENEQRIVDGVSIPQYFNDNILPTDKKFRTLSVERSATICPFHTDTDPSLKYWADTKSFKCFGCSAAGNVIRMHILWQRTHFQRSINQQTAIKELSEMYNIPLQLDEKGEVLQESAFDLARKRLNTSQYKGNGISMENMSIAGFRTFNNQVKAQVERSPYITGEQAAKMYYKLDLLLSGYLADKNETESEKG